jgi:23S rRNA (pseudouridine1915-N3)-methyltransferase
VSGVLLLWVGRRPPQAVESLCEEYRSRLARLLEVDEIRVRPQEGRGHDPQRALSHEAEGVLRHLQPGDYLVALDERGREHGSEELARWLARRLRHGRVVFAIGSDLGLGEAVKARAGELLALSRLTLPHHLARLLLLEQLYRAADISAGGAYHRGTV